MHMDYAPARPRWSMTSARARVRWVFNGPGGVTGVRGASNEWRGFVIPGVGRSSPPGPTRSLMATLDRPMCWSTRTSVLWPSLLVSCPASATGVRQGRMFDMCHSNANHSRELLTHEEWLGDLVADPNDAASIRSGYANACDSTIRERYAARCVGHLQQPYVV
jgi:hypothetical protein